MAAAASRISSKHLRQELGSYIRRDDFGEQNRGSSLSSSPSSSASASSSSAYPRKISASARCVDKALPSASPPSTMGASINDTSSKNNSSAGAGVVVHNKSFVEKSFSALPDGNLDGALDEIWLKMREEARRDAEAEPALASYLYSTILAHRSLERALAFHLGNKLSSSTLLSSQLFTMFVDTFMEDGDMREAIRADISAVRERDPACVSYSHCMLNFKGFLACQAHRVSHRLWSQGRHSLALALQSRVSEVFHVDIHPAAKIGRGVLFDHATGLVVGETATIGNNVSILHNVTLGGTGAMGGDRHPKICDGVLIGAGAIILGPVRIGEGAKIGAGSVVLIEVPPHTTAVGNPARLVGGKRTPTRLRDIPSETMDHTSFMSAWSDYVI